jgi:hypothetical protein
MNLDFYIFTYSKILADTKNTKLTRRKLTRRKLTRRKLNLKNVKVY